MIVHRSFALHVSTMTLPGTSVNAGQKGNDAYQIRDQPSPAPVSRLVVSAMLSSLCPFS
jgi:hypothetical protein